VSPPKGIRRISGFVNHGAARQIEGADVDSNVVWIVIAVVVAIIAIALIAFLARSARNKRRHAQAEELREEIGQKTHHVEKREATAAETEARARAAQAEAEVKAAEAARLQDTARSHRDAATNSREELDAHRERADALDPKRDDDQGPKADVRRADGAETQQVQAETPTTKRHRL
jgi:flagellar biosynthesis/type III secretory pathway M-ring protein FliF/YscJ